MLTFKPVLVACISALMLAATPSLATESPPPFPATGAVEFWNPRINRPGNGVRIEFNKDVVQLAGHSLLVRQSDGTWSGEGQTCDERGLRSSNGTLHFKRTKEKLEIGGLRGSRRWRAEITDEEILIAGTKASVRYLRVAPGTYESIESPKEGVGIRLDGEAGNWSTGDLGVTCALAVALPQTQWKVPFVKKLPKESKTEQP